jgi:hypothetical protein
MSVDPMSENRELILCCDADDCAAADAAMARMGAVILEDLIPSDWCDEMLSDFQVPLDEITLGEDVLGYREGFHGTLTKRLHGLFRWSNRLSEVVLHPTLMTMVDALVVAKSGARSFRLSNAELMVIYEGQERQVLHRDSASWPTATSGVGGVRLLNVIVALTPFTERQGATRLVPGSHEWPACVVPQPESSVVASMQKGSALLYSGDLWHGGGAHQGDAPRAGLYFGFIPSWLKPLENHVVTNGQRVVERLPERLQQLLDVEQSGFTVYA